MLAAEGQPGAPGYGGRRLSPVALVILDGWGQVAAGPGNAVELARTPAFDGLWQRYPHGSLSASGLDVGLPAGQIGNSEVGHLNLGAGRVVYQDLTRIDRAINDGSFAANEAIQSAARTAIDANSTLHLVGLMSHGGVHSSLAHIQQLVRTFALAGVRRVRLHAITDGRDVMPDRSLTDMPGLEQTLQMIAHEVGNSGDAAQPDIAIGTVVGRYWGMDRDQRWDRTQRAWRALVHREGAAVDSASDAVRQSHEVGTTDEFVEPSVVQSPSGEPEPGISDRDVVFLANFRPDRMRQLVHCFVDHEFGHFDRGAVPDVRLFCMTEYDPVFALPVAFSSSSVPNSLADVLEAEGIGQLHVAETEKYAHVTYFFDGGDERLREGEQRQLVDSARDVPTYDHKPQMSAEGVADAFCEHIGDDGVGFAVINFANPDMVGHTGVLDAAVAACETVDHQLRRVVEAVHSRGGVCIVTADHGNAEVMLTDDGQPHTAHTTNPVPVVITLPDDAGAHAVRGGGRLADVAPTVLELLGVGVPPEMTGTSLLTRTAVPSRA